MSERRDAVAKAMYANYRETIELRRWDALEPDSPAKRRCYELADAAIAALTAAVPTDAEVEAARSTYEDDLYITRYSGLDRTARETRAMRAALTVFISGLEDRS